MARKMRTFAHKNMPQRFPLFSTAMWITAGSYWQIPGWAWGVLGTILVMMWFAWAFWLFVHNEISVDVPNDA